MEKSLEEAMGYNAGGGAGGENYDRGITIGRDGWEESIAGLDALEG